MSYFMVINGRKPELPKEANLRIIPLSDEQKYVREVVQRCAPHFDSENTWSISDGSHTMELISKEYDEVMMGANPSGTLFSKVIEAVFRSGCKVFVWWADAVSGERFEQLVKKAGNPKEFLEIVTQQQGIDGNVCVLGEPV